jgi:hypothetical protein
MLISSVLDMDPNSIGHQDPDLQSNCGSGSRRPKKSSNEEKNEAKRPGLWIRIQ